MPGNKICRKHTDADSGIIRFPRQVCFIAFLPSVVVYGWLLGLQLTIMMGSWEGLVTGTAANDNNGQLGRAGHFEETGGRGSTATAFSLSCMRFLLSPHPSAVPSVAGFGRLYHAPMCPLPTSPGIGCNELTCSRRV
jgi:hypothetical protein